MSAYRFCRTDDIGLLVDALNRCWRPYFPDQAPVTAATFKRSIRDLQVWCSSCMVAFSGSDVIGVLIGAKRRSGTLVHRIAVHPDHRREGHGRHLLASLASKLAILGPSRIVAEIPEALAPARELFSASGYGEAGRLIDYVWRADSPQDATIDWRSHSSLASDRIVIPVTVDDLAANGLLEDPPPRSGSAQHPVPPSALARQGERQVCWERSVETLTARKDDIAGLAIVSDDRIEAYVLYLRRGIGSQGSQTGSEIEAPGIETEIVALRSLIDDGGARFEQLLVPLRARGIGTLTLSKVHPCEIPPEWLQNVGFSAAGGHILYSADARST